MENDHHNSGELPAFFDQKGNEPQRGKLKIFFGISPGVGKTYAMLQAAHVEAGKGVQVAVGCVKCQTRPETQALLEGLNFIPYKEIEYKGMVYEEMDLDAMLEIHPQLAVIDDLAHTNVAGCNNAKRYQDVWELLDNGIDVYTTLNMVHLESYVDTIYQLTGLRVSQSLSDEIFEQVDEVELVDATYSQLIARLKEGKIYTANHSQEKMAQFFQKERISVMREMAFRLMAERLNKQQKLIQETAQPKKRLLVLIGPDTISAQAIRKTKTMAGVLDQNWVSLYIKTSRALNAKEKKQLDENIKLVKLLDGEMIVFSSNDIVKTCLAVARRENISQIIVGKSEKRQLFGYAKKNIVNRLIRESGNINVYVVGSEARDTPEQKDIIPPLTNNTLKYVLTVISAIAIAMLCISLSNKMDHQFLPFLLLMVLFLIAVIFRMGPILLSTIVIILACGVFLIPPSFTFRFDTSSDLITFLIFFVFALFSGVLTTRFWEQEKQAVYREKQTNALFLFTQRLARAIDVKDIVEISMEDIRKYFSVDVFYIFRDDKYKLTIRKYIPQGLVLSKSDLETATWAFKHDRPAGKFTDTMPSSKYTYYPLKNRDISIGVVVAKQNKPFSTKVTIFWDAFFAQIARAIEHLQLGQLTRRTNLLDESDKLYKTLFNTISHEFRIPVATIMGASDILLSTDHPNDTKIKLYREILGASQRINRLVGNLLNMSRLESGRIALTIDWCDVHDLLNQVTENLSEELKPFYVDVSIPEAIALVKLDFDLMEQALFNLVINACQYAKEGTTIRLKALYKGDELILEITDRGPGFNPDDLPFVFDKFWRSKNSKTGGLGLGLSIVKGFVEAHRGTISVENRKNGGVRFTIKIPTEISNGIER